MVHRKKTENFIDIPRRFRKKLDKKLRRSQGKKEVRGTRIADR